VTAAVSLGSLTGRTVTVHHDRTVIDGTECYATSDRMDSLAYLAARAAVLFADAAGGTLIVAGDALDRLGLPDELPEDGREHDSVRHLRQSGWNVSGLAPWMNLWAVGRPTVHVGVHPWIDPTSTGSLYSADADDMGRLAFRYHALTGGAFHTSPGTAGLGLLREVVPPIKQTPRWRADVRDWPSAEGAEADINWQAPDLDPGAYGYDSNRAYLAAAQSVPVAVGSLRSRRGRDTFTPDLAGYWLIRRVPWNDSRMPHPDGYTDDSAAEVWVTTPTVRLLEQLAADGHCDAPMVLDAYVAPASRVLRRWAGLLNAAHTRALLHPEQAGGLALVRAVKDSYRHAVGQLATPTGRVYRPDWRHAVIAEARCNLWRKVWRVGLTEGRWPAVIDVDQVVYPAAECGPDPVASCPRGFASAVRPAIGTELGQFKVKAWSR
jgi:hypothetical protein